MHKPCLRAGDEERRWGVPGPPNLLPKHHTIHILYVQEVMSNFHVAAHYMKINKTSRQDIQNLPQGCTVYPVNRTFVFFKNIFSCLSVDNVKFKETLLYVHFNQFWYIFYFHSLYLKFRLLILNNSFVLLWRLILSVLFVYFLYFLSVSLRSFLSCLVYFFYGSSYWK